MPRLEVESGVSRLLANNEKWVAEKTAEDPEYFKMIGAGQKPHYLYIGCADARVQPERMMGLKQDELFVTRNVGNLACADMNFLSVLEYGISVLKIPHVIVCGHYECGAVRTAVKKVDVGLVTNWIRDIRDVYRLHAEELDAIKDEDERHRRLVDLNVREQCMNVYKSAAVQRERMATAGGKGPEKFITPRIHGMVFDPHTGLLKNLDIDFQEDVRKYNTVYELFQRSVAAEDASD